MSETNLGNLNYYYYEVKDTNNVVIKVKKIKVNSITKCKQGNRSSENLYFINKYVMAIESQLTRSKELEQSGVQAEERIVAGQTIPDDIKNTEFYMVLGGDPLAPVGKKRVVDVALAEGVHAVIVNGEALLSVKSFAGMDLSNLPEVQ